MPDKCIHLLNVPLFLMRAEQLSCLSTSSVTLKTKSQYLGKKILAPKRRKTSSWKSQQGHLLADDWACLTCCYLNRIKHPEQMMGWGGWCLKVPFSRKIPHNFSPFDHLSASADCCRSAPAAQKCFNKTTQGGQGYRVEFPVTWQSKCKLPWQDQLLR